MTEGGRRAVGAFVAVAVLFGVGVAGLAARFGYLALTYKAYDVPTATMEPSIMNGDRIRCTRGAPERIARGDVVVFVLTAPGGGESQSLVKRVVGLPGETVASPTGSTVTVDGRDLAEPYADLSGSPQEFEPVTVASGHYFVLGDNRVGSADSRLYGAIPRSAVRGVCTRILAPKDRAGRIPGT